MTSPPQPLRPQIPAALRQAFADSDAAHSWLESVPGFLALWRVGAPRQEDEQLIEAERYLLVAKDRIRAADRLRLEARLAAGFRTRLLRLRTAVPAQLKSTTQLHCRELCELGLAAELVAGDDSLRSELSGRPLGSPHGKAALQLFRSHIELLLRAYPEPYMLRSAVQRGSPVGFPDFVDADTEARRIQAELVRGIGDAWLLLLGRFTADREERCRRLVEHFATRPSLRRTLSWAFGQRPCDSEAPEGAILLWHELRGLLLDGFAGAVQHVTRGTCAIEALPDFIRVCRPGLLARLLRRPLAEEGSLADRIDALLLQLVIAKLDGDNVDFGMLGGAIRRMADAEGPALANPTWDKLRREALCLRRYAPDLSETG